MRKYGISKDSVYEAKLNAHSLYDKQNFLEEAFLGNIQVVFIC